MQCLSTIINSVSACTIQTFFATVVIRITLFINLLLQIEYLTLKYLQHSNEIININDRSCK